MVSQNYALFTIWSIYSFSTCEPYSFGNELI